MRSKTELKVEKIRKEIFDGNVELAASLADEINLDKVKESYEISVIADAYFQNKEYLKAKKCYERMYLRKPTRNVVSRLAHICVKLKKVNEAKHFTDELERLDSKDFYIYIYKYNIAKMEGKSLEERIEILEQLKEMEYIENWAYELAKLYHKTEQADKCVAECKDIITWFGEGEYVERAKALKAYYEGTLDVTMAGENSGQFFEQVREVIGRRQENEDILNYESEQAQGNISGLEYENSEEAPETYTNSDIDNETLTYNNQFEERYNYAAEETVLYESTEQLNNSEYAEENRTDTFDGESFIEDEDFLEAVRRNAEAEFDLEPEAGSVSADSVESEAEGVSADNSESETGSVSADNSESEAEGVSADNSESEAESVSADSVESEAGSVSADSVESEAGKVSADTVKITETEAEYDSCDDVHEKELLEKIHEELQNSKSISKGTNENAGVGNSIEGNNADYAAPEKKYTGENIKEEKINREYVEKELEGKAYTKAEEKVEKEGNKVSEKNEEEMLQADTVKLDNEFDYNTMPDNAVINIERPDNAAVGMKNYILLNKMLKVYRINAADIFGGFMCIQDTAKQIMKTFESIMEDSINQRELVITDKGTGKGAALLLAKRMARFLKSCRMVKSEKTAVINAARFNAFDIADRKEQFMDCCIIVEHAGALKQEIADGIIKLKNELKGRIFIILTDGEENINRLYAENKMLTEEFSNIIRLSEYGAAEWRELAYDLIIKETYDINKGASDELLKKLENMVLADGNDNWEKISAYLKEVITASGKKHTELLYKMSAAGKFDDTSLMVLHKGDFL